MLLLLEMISTVTEFFQLHTCTCVVISFLCRHFSLQATDPLDLGDAVRLKVENKICHQDGPRVDSFAVPQQQVYDLLRKVTAKAINHVMWVGG